MAQMFIISFCCLLAFLISRSVAQDQEMGPADLFIKRVEECENPEIYPQKMGIEVHKVNRSHSGITGCLDLGRDMDNMVTLNVSVAKWGDGGWKPNQFNYWSDNACDTLVKQVAEPWEMFLAAAGVLTRGCPLLKGNYCVEKLIVDMSGTFPSMIYGDMRVDADLYVEGQLKRCVRLFLESVPAKH